MNGCLSTSGVHLVLFYNVSHSFDKVEKILLVDLVSDHFQIVENKRTDAVTMKQKTSEWQTLAEEYNSQTTYAHRTAENLKSQWKSLKKATKKKVSNTRMSFIKTGGGPPKPKNEDPVMEKILTLIALVTQGLYNPFDSDSDVPPIQVPSQDVEMQPVVAAVSSQTQNDMQANLPYEEIIIELENPQKSEIIKNDWGDYTPKLLKTPTSKLLRQENWTSRRRPASLANKTPIVDDLQKKKIEAIQKDIEYSAEEREETKKKHGIEIELIALELELKKEQMKQEKIKTRILLLELRKKRKESKEK